jgi:hypothetical protein
VIREPSMMATIHVSKPWKIRVQLGIASLLEVISQSYYSYTYYVRCMSINKIQSSGLPAQRQVLTFVAAVLCLYSNFRVDMISSMLPIYDANKEMDTDFGIMHCRQTIPFPLKEVSYG